jgi:hypothetical protein
LVICGHWVADDVQRLRATVERTDDRRDVLRLLHIKTDDLKSEFAGGRKKLFDRQFSGGVIGIGEDRELSEPGKEIAQYFEPLAGEIGLLVR